MRSAYHARIVDAFNVRPVSHIVRPRTVARPISKPAPVPIAGAPMAPRRPVAGDPDYIPPAWVPLREWCNPMPTYREVAQARKDRRALGFPPSTYAVWRINPARAIAHREARELRRRIYPMRSIGELELWQIVPLVRAWIHEKRQRER